MTDTETEILKECERQEENCLYTFTVLMVWLRSLRRWRRVFIFGQVVFSVCAAAFAVAGHALAAGAFGSIAGLSPIVWGSLQLDGQLEVVSRHASLFVELRDRFRRIKNIEATKGLKVLEREFQFAVEDLAGARKYGVSPPEKYFAIAQEKIRRGDYENSIDELPPGDR